MEKDIKRVINEVVRTGSTTWILKAAIENPNCVIISKNYEQSTVLRKEYFKMILNSPWYKKLYWRWINKKHPKFIPISCDFHGIRMPIVFDNGTFV